MPSRDIKTVDKNAARFDVKYVKVYGDHEFPKDAWEAWSKDQQQTYIDELKRQEQASSE